MQLQVIVAGTVRSCGRVRLSTADADVRMIVGCIQTNSVCWGCQLTRRRSVPRIRRVHTVLRRFTLRYIILFPSPVTIRVKNGSFLYWEGKETQVAIRSSRYLAVRLCGTQRSNFLVKPKLTSRLSTIVWCTLKIAANSCTVGPNYGRQRYFGVRLKFKQIIGTDSDDENEMQKAVPVPTLSEMRNIMKIHPLRPPKGGRNEKHPKSVDFSQEQACKGDRFNSCQVIYSQFGLAIHQNDHQARPRFVEWAQNEIAVVPYFHKRILFSDEAHFWLNGYVNKQNCRIWSEANPQVYVETPLHPEKLTVWCALWTGRIIGPYFFKNDKGHNVTVNGDRYRAMITNFFIPELNNHDVQELWFQQDGATCHTARATIDLLKDTFSDRLISRFGPVNWPPRSCDLTPLDYFLWGYVKSLVYADKPQTLDHLEDNIRRVIANIRPQMLEKVIENWTSRLDYIRASRGSPMPEIIFKM
ncbi:transposable element Tc3 transposase [Trichonephila clavipes]|uniref:Transposable element Tc3 transposase n=1 Tax=Trichonephila clavipes TaxID=2585209 RepID=A0A8X6RXK5_TRICX|nr:transposable element Tc3 transposase [Trichonephila clavipes]